MLFLFNPKLGFAELPSDVSSERVTTSVRFCASVSTIGRPKSRTSAAVVSNAVSDVRCVICEVRHCVPS